MIAFASGSGRYLAWALLLMTALTASGAAQVDPTRVLIVYSYRSTVVPYQHISSAFQTALVRNLAHPVEFHELSLDLDHFPEPPMQSILAEFIKKRFTERPLDLVVTIGAPAAQFVVQFRDFAFANSPAVFLAADARILSADPSRENATLVTHTVSPAGWVEDILQLAPDTANVVFLMGVSPLERTWADIIRRELKIYSGRVNITILEGMSFDEIEKRVSVLPPHSFIHAGLMIRDLAGISYGGNEVLQRLHEAANAPINGIYSSQMGFGIVGGRLYQDQLVAIRGAESAARILRGERAADIPSLTLGPSPPIYDGRELKRWGIPESRLPAGSTVLYREPTFWYQYRWRIAGVTAFIILETMLIIGLLMNLRRRRRVEQSLRQSEERYRGVFEAELDALFLINSETGRILDANPAAERMYGYSREEFLQLMTDDISAEPEKSSEARQTGVTHIPLHFHRRKNHTIFPAEISAGRVNEPGQRLFVVAMRDITERLQAEENLRQSEQKYRRLYESMMDALVTVDMDGHIQEFNPAYLQMLGYSEDELRRSTYMELTPEKWHEFEAQIVREHVVKRGYSDVYEKEYRRKDGAVFPVELRTFLLTDEFHEPLGMWAIVRDITERKRAQEALRESEERLRLAASAAGFGAFSFDVSNRNLFCTPELLGLYGLPPDASLELDEYDVPKDVHPEDKNIFRAGFMSAADPSGPGILDVEYRILPAGRQLRWLRSSARFVFSAAGQPLRIDGITQDITKRKLAEEALRQSEERFRQITETVSDFVWEVDANGVYTYTSPSVERILGYRPDELVGKKHFYDLFTPDIREELKTAALQTFENRGTFQALPNSNLSKSGQIVYLETSGIPILGDAGCLLGYRGADTDVTARRRAEMESQLLREELALSSRVATMGELTASIAHELNQPLAAILSNAQAALRLIENGEADLKELREIFEDISADDQRAAEVIRSLRAMLKRGPGVRQPLFINNLIKDVLSIVRTDGLAKRISINLDLGSPMPPVSGDRVQLQQVILNLVINAFEAMEASDKSRELQIRTRREGKDIILDVIDSGFGIPSDKLEAIFQPFFTTKTSGLGMGLALSRTIVIAHNGRLWAESNAQIGGATFHLALPIEEPQPQTASHLGRVV